MTFQSLSKCLSTSTFKIPEPSWGEASPGYYLQSSMVVGTVSSCQPLILLLAEFQSERYLVAVQEHPKLFVIASSSVVSEFVIL